MNERDQKIRDEILKLLCDQAEDDPYRSISLTQITDTLATYDNSDLRYIAERLDGEYAEVNQYMGGRMDLQIIPEGIEHLHERGYATILAQDTRYNILEHVYQKDRNSSGPGYVSRDNLLEAIAADQEEIDVNVWYLKEKRLLDTMTGGGSFYGSVEITERGRKRWEAHRDEGTEIPQSSTFQSRHQTSIGPNQREEAENLFRDIVEVARNEVIILDRFARKPLYEWLDHVQRGVTIRVLTTDRVIGDEYHQAVGDFQQSHAEIEVRSISDSVWDFHDRYLIRDQVEAWAWGHSFHDSGDTQHTVSELKPVNRDTILEQFEERWSDGDTIQ